MELLSTIAPPPGSTDRLPAPLPEDAAGRLLDVASFFAAAQGASPEAPLRPIRQPRMTLWCGERPAAGASLLSPERADALRRDFERGAGPTRAFAESAGVPAEAVEVSPGLALEEALSLGIRTADAQADSGVDLALPASLGAGDEEEALALLGLLTGKEPVSVLGFHGTADAAWSERVTLVRDLMFAARGHRSSAENTLRHHASAAMAALVGYIAQSAARRTPVLLDTTVTCVAACYAEALAPGAKAWLLAGQLTPHAGHLIAARHLGITPLLALNMPLGMGTGAATTLPLVRAATALYARERD
ncbi:nicotinate-nucleotide--dimethylbenzimidazole phosphoribosyltransferase [Corynebacterium mastitidis]|uniref:nicotinate-nucleotide--dimethylbenzimidazole phosphoribosyltransferase n=1 Tax=Corynebacterium mastitidis TaxID=161890 RepID=UPI00254A6CF4|nr:nicotinate-nucleotide--dimethylbenzimidazole phosphoribosyltransferase [Corynebacterium mastitidis]MDK8449521.1 nicotinate-nucleotide--dimethylbenzimidazole phosphoribosyltransferase [Corynebacterium mastitidis]